MNCESALELLLDAEPSELSGTAITPLGDHVRGCARCRRVAGQLLSDTRALALAMAAPVSVRRRSRRTMQVTIVPAFAMAAIVFAVMLRGGGTQAPNAVEPVIDPAPSLVTPPAVARVEVPDPPASRPGPARIVRRDGQAFARAVPLAPVRLAPAVMPEAPLSVEMSGVTVTPPAGTRATVMHTSNPKLLVVWLY
jgi:hypothetical protein